VGRRRDEYYPYRYNDGQGPAPMPEQINARRNAEDMEVL